MNEKFVFFSWISRETLVQSHLILHFRHFQMILSATLVSACKYSLKNVLSWLERIFFFISYFIHLSFTPPVAHHFSLCRDIISRCCLSAKHFHFLFFSFLFSSILLNKLIFFQLFQFHHHHRYVFISSHFCYKLLLSCINWSTTIPLTDRHH